MSHKIIVSNLLISNILILIILGFSYSIWFPGSLSVLLDLNKDALILLLVNLCLFSVFTYFAYKKNTKHQKLDLTVIAIFQVSAIVFGSYSIYAKHPVYAVFAIDRFTLISAINATPANARFREFDSSLLSKTKFAYAKMPRDPKQRDDIFMGYMFKGESDLDGRSEYYEPYSKYSMEVLKKGLNINEILKKEGTKEKLDLFFVKYGGNKDKYAYLPLQTNTHDVIWVLDKQNAEPVGILEIDPWQFSRPISDKTKKKKPVRRWLI